MFSTEDQGLQELQNTSSQNTQTALPERTTNIPQQISLPVQLATKDSSAHHLEWVLPLEQRFSLFRDTADSLPGGKTPTKSFEKFKYKEKHQV